MKNNKLRLVTLMMLLAINGFTQPFNKTSIDSLINTIAIGRDAMFSLAISRNDTPVYYRSVGYSDLTGDSKVSASENTRYRIGSITKVFTSAIIFQLIEEGKLLLTTPLAKYFPALPNASKITMANLLNHSSGLFNFTEDSAYTAMLDKKMTREAMLDLFKVKAPVFEPGSKHAYSNTNYILLGYIIENLEGKPYADVLQARICRRIGLKNTYYGSKINIASHEANSYRWENGWVPDTETDMSIPGGAGAIVSTPVEINKFMTALFSGKLVADSSLSHMTTIVGGYGMDLVSKTVDGKTGYGHAGGIDGFRSLTIYFPEEQLAVTYTANAVKTPINRSIANVISLSFND